MYSVAVKRVFDAQHYLVGGDWGAENQLHTHHYQVELQLHGDILDEHGYLVDIVQIEACLEAAAAHYRGVTLNDEPEFAELNPSIEHFSRILAQRLSDQIPAANIHSLTVKVWENEIAWSSYTLART
jgi:6-pyruvoyltetrahydropterin/6-carboxytetrahydropterin synthase